MFDNVNKFNFDQKTNLLTMIVLTGLISSEGEELHFRNKGKQKFHGLKKS